VAWTSSTSGTSAGPGFVDVNLSGGLVPRTLDLGALLTKTRL
jgi:hypothetical protein